MTSYNCVYYLDNYSMFLSTSQKYNPFLGTYVNIADPVQKPQNTASDQGLYCLLAGIPMQNTVKVKLFTRNPLSKKLTHPNDNNGQVPWSKRVTAYNTFQSSIQDQISSDFQVSCLIQKKYYSDCNCPG